MRIAGEQFSVKCLSSGIDDGVGGGQFVLAVQVGGTERDTRVERGDDAFLRVGDASSAKVGLRYARRRAS